MTLPVQAILPALKNALQDGQNVVLQAPPGAGKTTLVPLELLEEAWLEKRKIILLQPRRLATRAAARRMAGQLHEAVGKRVGYRIRFENRVGPDTRIEVVTEAVLTRKLQKDPEIADTGLVIFDEFHERSIHSDLGLALCREVQAELRADLRILVMSATLAGDSVAQILGNAGVIACEGRQYPVETFYQEKPVLKITAALVVTEIERILDSRAGSLLVFLPGAGEIRRVTALLHKKRPQGDLIIAPLFGDLPGKKQDLAIKPCPTGKRKVVLSTSIAETSLTIDGINIVVDAGQMRIPRFQPGSLMTALETVRVSKASADQRRGRAGRTGPGACFRLWTEHDQLSLIPYTKPEILNTDLCPLALELACWGNPETTELVWLDPPPEAALARAWEYLHAIAAVDNRRRVTRHGRRINELGVHPRLGHMILKGVGLGCGRIASEMAALISRRDILSRTFLAREADIRVRLDLLHPTTDRRDSTGQKPLIDRHTLNRTLQLSERWQKIAGHEGSASGQLDDAGKIMALAYPDRVGKLRNSNRNRYLLSGGRGAVLPDHDPLCGTPFIVVARTDGQPDDARIFLAAPVAVAELEEVLDDRIFVREKIAWDGRKKAVTCRKQHMLGNVVLREINIKNPDNLEICKCLIKGIHEAGLDCLPFTREDRNWMARVQFVGAHSKETGQWPDLSPAALLKDLGAWLQPYITGLRSLASLKKLNMKKILGSMLNWEQRRALDRLAPPVLNVPSSSRIRLDYTAGEIPALAVRLQEVFGLDETPTIMDGQCKVTVHLLSPAGRPVQITRDLAGFWNGAYTEVKKEMKGRYPKHYWPDNPLDAVATRRVKPKTKKSR
ncbi:MAG: ATP-dependent helicase HrpB [Desulfobacterales bacterium]|nr:ATP-dependent helicase HrpB [Desulfobacterales bacterium]